MNKRERDGKEVDLKESFAISIGEVWIFPPVSFIPLPARDMQSTNLPFGQNSHASIETPIDLFPIENIWDLSLGEMWEITEWKTVIVLSACVGEC